MNEEITLRLETFNDKEYILADDCIKAIGIHRKTNTKLHKEIKRLKEEYMMLQNASDKVEEEKDKEIERLNNDIKELLKENGNKEKVIKAQDNIINEFNEFIEEVYNHINLGDESDEFMLVFDKWQELKGSVKE